MSKNKKSQENKEVLKKDTSDKDCYLTYTKNSYNLTIRK